MPMPNLLDVQVRSFEKLIGQDIDPAEQWDFGLDRIFAEIFPITDANETLTLGKTIFLQKGNCAACHALSDAGSNGDIGPNLNEIKPSFERVVMTVTNGIGVMPAWEGILTKEEIEAVAYYIFNSTN